jgi:hypothetical protein
MDGIRFVLNHSGQRVAVMIDLEKYSELWEDFYDSLLAEMRKDEPTSSLAAVRRSIIKKQKLNG